MILILDTRLPPRSRRASSGSLAAQPIRLPEPAHLPEKVRLLGRVPGKMHNVLNVARVYGEREPGGHVVSVNLEGAR